MSAFMITLRIFDMARARGVCKTLRVNVKMYEDPYHSVVYGSRDVESKSNIYH